MIAGHIQNRKLKKLILYCKHCECHSEFFTDLLEKELTDSNFYCSICGNLESIKKRGL